jgi:hypothetical protein
MPETERRAVWTTRKKSVVHAAMISLERSLPGFATMSVLARYASLFEEDIQCPIDFWRRVVLLEIP